MSLPPRAFVSLGYDVQDRKLVINEAEAASVCRIFERFVELGSDFIETSRNQRNRGETRSRQFIEMYGGFEPVSPEARGGWKETVGVRRPILRSRPVSKGRMAPANPFGTYRKRPREGPVFGFALCKWRRG